MKQVKVAFEKVAELEQNLHKLNSSRQAFADSLINGPYGIRQRGYLTEKQAKYFFEILEQASAELPSVVVTQVGALHGLLALFAKAQPHLKYPKIKLEVDGFPVMLKMAGPNSKYAGSVIVTDGSPYPSNKYYGAVSPEGGWQQGKQYPEMDAVETLLKAMARNPESTAQKYGHMTGNCCFCNLPIGEGEDQSSVYWGYGPTCAKNYGLAWKSIPKDELAEKLKSIHAVTVVEEAPVFQLESPVLEEIG